ncbi:MAG: DUF2306 domain-containing protein [Pseudomonadota bacterium]
MLESLATYLSQKPAALTVHLAGGVVAFGLGTVLLLGAKGTQLHRTLGRVFVLAIVVTAFSGFFIYEILGALGPFHVLSAFTLVTVLGGVKAIRKASPACRAEHRGGAVSAHINRMVWCFTALVIAASIEALRLFPSDPEALRLAGFEGKDVIIASAVTLAVAAWLTITATTLWVRWRRPSTALPQSFGEAPIAPSLKPGDHARSEPRSIPFNGNAR